MHCSLHRHMHIIYVGEKRKRLHGTNLETDHVLKGIADIYSLLLIQQTNPHPVGSM